VPEIITPANPHGRLDGKVALITGTGSGQGRAAALLFAGEGARVVGCDLNAAGAAETEEMVRSQGGEMTSMTPVDLGDPDQATAWVDAAAAAYGGIDVLYNNASAPRFGPIDKVSTEDWHFTIRNELDLVFFVTRAAWPHLVARGRGSIINVGSAAGVMGIAKIPGVAHAATKGAVIALTRQLVGEGAPHKIRANTLSPGFIATPATTALFATEPIGTITRSVPLGGLANRKRWQP
jgi:NAD(P)-dependent dehydrogenase (short-subunit alcohol dehydrogenase family)